MAGGGPNDAVVEVPAERNPLTINDELIQTGGRRDCTSHKLINQLFFFKINSFRIKIKCKIKGKLIIALAITRRSLYRFDTDLAQPPKNKLHKRNSE